MSSFFRLVQVSPVVETLKITIEGDVEVLIFSTKYDLFLLTE